jgi:hypothetical protein
MFSRAQQALQLIAIKANSLELALYSTDPTASDTGTECSGGSYARQAITFGANTVVAGGTQIANTNLITFPQASADWTGTVAYWGVRIVGGALVGSGQISSGGTPTTRVVRSGDTYQQAIGSVVLKVND